MWWSVGFALLFGASILGIFAGVLAVVAVGGHLLSRRDEDAARVIGFDPSSVASRAPFPAAAALALCGCFVVIFLLLRRGKRSAR